MALATSEHSSPPAPMAPTRGVGAPPPQGVGMQGAPPPVEPLPPAEPVLFSDIDPVLLVRLYPGAKDAADMRAQAMAAGQAVHEQGLELVASQQEPVVGAGEEPQPKEPPPPAQPPPRPQQPPAPPHEPNHSPPHK